MNKDKLLSASNYNIGFSVTSKEEMIKNKCISKIHWMRHKYNDRFFADPFILDVTDEYIKVLVEECSFENLHHAGIISELWVDRKNYKLKQRYELLKLKTHLSYPAIIREGEKIYVYPESNESGVLSLYEYDEKAHKLVNPVVILDEPLADATMCKVGEKYILAATKMTSTRKDAFLYVSDSFKGNFKQLSEEPFEKSIRCSRSAGDFFFVDGVCYRPAQDCDGGYGLATTIMKVEFQKDKMIRESEMFQIRPQKGKYDKCLHTLNFFQNVCVVDGRDYIYPWKARYALTVMYLQDRKMSVIHLLGRVRRFVKRITKK